MYRIRVVLDTEEDVIRDIVLSPEQNLSTLHHNIVKAFNLEEGEMASFFASNDNWEQGEEISLVDFGALSGSSARLMEKTSVRELLGKEESKMIYVYDLLNLWTFFVELIQIDEEKTDNIQIIKIVGERPEKAPSKSMESINLEEDMDDELGPDDDFSSEEDHFDFNLN